MANKRSAQRSPAAPVSFDGVLAAHGNNTGIVVPADVIDHLNSGRRPAVSVDLNGYVSRSTVGVMSGEFLIAVSAAIRKATGLVAGDSIHIQLSVDSSPREVEVPPDFAAALTAAPKAKKFFEQLSNSLQRYHVDQITSARTAETRGRRIVKAVDTFLSGEKQ